MSVLSSTTSGTAAPLVNRGGLDKGAHHVAIFAVEREIAAVCFEQWDRQLLARRSTRFEQCLVNAVDQGPEQILLIAEIPIESAERYSRLFGNVDHLEGDIAVASQHSSSPGGGCAYAGLWVWSGIGSSAPPFQRPPPALRTAIPRASPAHALHRPSSGWCRGCSRAAPRKPRSRSCPDGIKRKQGGLYTDLPH